MSEPVRCKGCGQLKLLCVCAIEQARPGRRPTFAGHPPTDECPDPECEACSVRDCRWGEPFHYHHDGCPSCSFDDGQG